MSQPDRLTAVAAAQIVEACKEKGRTVRSFSKSPTSTRSHFFDDQSFLSIKIKELILKNEILLYDIGHVFLGGTLTIYRIM